jgi:hypothetical protein
LALNIKNSQVEELAGIGSDFPKTDLKTARLK